MRITGHTGHQEGRSRLCGAGGRPEQGAGVSEWSGGFDREHRLRTRSQINRVFAWGRSVADRHFVVYTRNNELGHSRLGLSVGRRVGGAVQRNRIKRLLREAFRLSRERIGPDLDVFVVVRGAGAPDRLEDVREALVRLAGRSARAKPRPRKILKRGRRRGNRGV